MLAVKAAAQRIKAEGRSQEVFDRDLTVHIEEARSLVEDWPEAPRMAAQQLLDRYGPPHEATPGRMSWHGIGPWTRMELTADQILHDFPTPHVDFFTQYIRYRVPPAKAAELAAFDGSVLVDRTAGELGSRCDHEAFNTLTLNLAVEIVQGQRSVEDARRLYAETAAAYVMGRPAPYAERLLFTPPEGGTADPDESAMGAEMLEQMVEKAKDAFGGGEVPH